MGSRNPPWERDELILALNIYMKHRPGRPSPAAPEVVDLSNLLNSLPINDEAGRQAGFRNSSAVHMKLGNFASLDPEHGRAGLQRTAKLDKKVWEEFSEDPDWLAATAAAIRDHAKASPASTEARGKGEEAEFPEGRILYRRHRSRDRSAAAVRDKKKLVLKEHHRLACEVCGFDFRLTYGEMGDGFIECHHTVPVCSLKPGHRTRASDLALVCPNCHRMLHRRRPWLGMDDLKLLLGDT